MDGEIPTSPNIPTPQKKKGLGALAFLEVGIFQIFFVVVALAVFFGVMNYFNILPISQIWPNYFGFLPRREVSTGTSQQTSPIISPTVPSTDQAKQTLLSFLPTILAPSLLPRSSEITLIQENENNKLSSPLNNSQGSGKITFVVSSDGKQIYELLIFSPYKTADSVSVQLAEKTIPQFFSVEPKGTWECKSLPNKATYCENFWEEENGIRKGVGIQESSPLAKDHKKLFIFYCEHKKESDVYSWKSCAKEFAQSGVSK